MRKFSVVVSLMILLFTGSVFAENPSEDVESFVPVFMPKGSKEAGRAVFQEMQCVVCHTVYGDKELPLPVSATPGPELWAPADEASIGWLLNSIVSPSHQIPERFRTSDQEEKSPMGDFSDVMTVRQLIDLVAFLRDSGVEAEKQ